ncbi:glucosaminidase domain-containing protein [Aneurinibacillus sp. UBA3580]|jgi:N-acetylmuramoyl-L-alanine amidase|uniref:glucosaminidase domain-containing protein n=1 Tax=Aneurinibacillus sp. UBA3580 TaxID=1946041 RepID=UPI00257C7791|nr:glucosaminidase domain-containing protein [Aneurinibacillus sp. UBA3580]
MVRKITCTAIVIGLVCSSGIVTASNQDSVHAESNAAPAPSFPSSSTGLSVKEKQTITGASIATEEQMLAFARSVNPAFPAELPRLYIEIGNIYGIRGDIAFCQMLKETGYHRFGGIVQANQHNYAGIGATGNSKTNKGNYFQTPEQGVRAHIQHLYAYATKSNLPKNEVLIDPRFKYVARGTAPNWQDLNGKWAVPGKGYGESILDIYSRMLSMPVIPKETIQ